MRRMILFSFFRNSGRNERWCCSIRNTATANSMDDQDAEQQGQDLIEAGKPRRRAVGIVYFPHTINSLSRYDSTIPAPGQ